VAKCGLDLLAQFQIELWANKHVVHVVMNRRVPYKVGNSTGRAILTQYEVMKENLDKKRVESKQS
jgi:hypothetical protein